MHIYERKGILSMKTTGKWMAALLALLLLPLWAQAEEMRGFDKSYPKAERYQWVRLGAYPYEKDGTQRPVLWKVLDVKEGQALLFSDIILDTRQAMNCDNQSDSEKRLFRRMDDFSESDLCAWMNEEMLPALLGDSPMMDALVETRYGRLYPLTDEQMLTPAYGFSAGRYDDVKGFPERQAVASPYAKSVNLYPDWCKALFVSYDTDTSPYWVIGFRNPGQANYMLQIAGDNGHLSYCVYSRQVGVRPALTLDVSLCRIISGDGTKSSPFVLEYKGTEE